MAWVDTIRSSDISSGPDAAHGEHPCHHNNNLEEEIDDWNKNDSLSLS